jgi:hypothetical protein
MPRLVVVLLVLAAGAFAAARGGPAPVAAQVAYECFGETATIVSDAPGAVVYGTGGRDVIFTDLTLANAQTIFAYGGNDLICAGTGDTVYAGSGNDAVAASRAAAIYGESGNDRIVSTQSGLVSGGSGADTLDGLLDAGAHGGAGNDAFVGNGVSSCDGGSGTDSETATACDASTSIP